jgi:glycosyltransferase involved in cell wall biosynthesis
MILFFLSGDITRSGGTENVACQIMNALCLNYDITVISLTEGQKETFYHLSEKIHRISLFKSLPSGVVHYFQIVRAIRNAIQNADILVDIDTILDIFSVPATIGLKTKLIAWEHFNFGESMGNRLRVPIRKIFTRMADYIVTLTKEDQNEYQRQFKRKKQIVQIYNPFCPIEHNSKYCINSRTLISVGRLASQKGFDILLNVAKLVLPKHPDWQWVILGEGPERNLLEDKIKHDHELLNVKLLGRVTNVNEYLLKSSIFVLTSRYEGFPLCLIEAKAAKLPIVAFSCKTGPTELIHDGINGYLVDCFNQNMMAERIEKLINDKELRQSFSDHALLDTEKMGLDYIKEQWVEVFEHLK